MSPIGADLRLHALDELGNCSDGASIVGHWRLYATPKRRCAVITQGDDLDFRLKVAN